MEPQTITIHGKSYIPVNERVKMAHAELKELSIATEILYTEPQVVIKAIVTTPKGTFMGISAANPRKTIENQNPFEVAETSAVGRALGFAGYGIVDSIASADEMTKAGVGKTSYNQEFAPKQPKTQTYMITPKQVTFLMKLLAEKGYFLEDLLTKYEVTKIDDLTVEQATTIIGNLMKLPAQDAIDVEKLNDEVEAGLQKTFTFKK